MLLNKLISVLFTVCEKDAYKRDSLLSALKLSPK